MWGGTSQIEKCLHILLAIRDPDLSAWWRSYAGGEGDCVGPEVVGAVDVPAGRPLRETSPVYLNADGIDHRLTAEEEPER